MQVTTHRLRFAALACRSLSLAGALALAACSRPDADVTPLEQGPAFQPVATVQDIMVNLVDPSADALWQSVETVYSAEGEDKRQPRTPEEWAVVKRQAVTLAEAANVLLIDGRKVSATEVPPEKQGYLSSKEIEGRIEANRADFNRFAVLLRETAVQAMAAIDAQDAEALLAAGGPIDAACEGCHLTFWYPGQGRPE